MEMIGKPHKCKKDGELRFVDSSVALRQDNEVVAVTPPDKEQQI